MDEFVVSVKVEGGVPNVSSGSERLVRQWRKDDGDEIYFRNIHSDEFHNHWWGSAFHTGDTFSPRRSILIGHDKWEDAKKYCKLSPVVCSRHMSDSWEIRMVPWALTKMTAQRDSFSVSSNRIGSDRNRKEENFISFIYLFDLVDEERRRTNEKTT